MSDPARYRVRVIIHEMTDNGGPLEAFNEQTYAADRKEVTELLELAASNAYAALEPKQASDARIAHLEREVGEYVREIAELSRKFAELEDRKMDRVRAGAGGWFDPNRAMAATGCKIRGCFCLGRAHAGHAPRTEDAAR